MSPDAKPAEPPVESVLWHEVQSLRAQVATLTAERDEARGLVERAGAQAERAADALSNLRSTLATVRSLVSKAPVPDSDGEGPTLGECDTAFAVLAELRERLKTWQAGRFRG